MDASVVADALNQLYNPLSSPRARRRADSLLQRFQKCPDATHTSLRVLAPPIPVATPTPEISAAIKAERAFAASTIYFAAASYTRKYKLDDAAHWTEEEKQMHISVTKEFGEICQQVWNILTGVNAAVEEANVQTHLALTVAVILLRFHEQHSDATVVSAIEWLVRNQQQSISDEVSSAATNYAILLTLKVMPEEVENRRVKFSKLKRIECQHVIQQSTPTVIQTVLPSIANAIDSSEGQSRLRGLFLKCFASWVEYGNIPPGMLLESRLVDRCFREIMQPSYADDALQAIREIVRLCTNDSYVPLMEVVMKNFVLLGKHIMERTAAQEDLSFCLQGCATAIAECGQTFVVYFVDYTLELHPGSLVYEFLDTILYFTSMNDLEISNETMDFWVDFRTYISGKNERRMEDFEMFISRLLSILVERTEFPVDYENYPVAAKDRFAGYRNDVRAVFRSLATVNAASEDKFVVDAIHVIFNQYDQLQNGTVPSNWWRKTEVYVHALSALSKSIREDDTSLMPRLFDCLSRDEPFHRALSRTITVFLGVTGHWFARNPSYLNVYAYKILSKSFDMSEEHKLYPFRVRGQEDHIGAVSLKKLTSRCGAHFFNQMWLDAILYLYRTNRPTSNAKSILKGNSIILIVEALAEVMATVSYKDALPVVEEFASIMFQDIASTYRTLNPDDEDSVSFLCELFDHLKVLATQIPPQIDQEIPHPVLCVLQSRWELLEGILQIYGSNEELAEKICSTLVGLFESLRTQAMELASALMTHLIEQFARSHNGNYLLVIKSILSCAGEDAESVASLTRVLVIVIESALSHIASTPNLDDNPMLVVSLLDLVGFCGAQRPMVLVQSNQLESLLALIIHTLKSQNPDVGSASLEFLLEINSWYGEVVRTPQAMLKSPEMEGKVMMFEALQGLFFEKDLQYHLLVALFHAAGGGLPPTLLENIAEVLRSCWTRFGKQRMEELIMRVLADDGFLAPHVAAKARGEFAVTISRQECLDNSRKFRRVLSSFCDHYRKSLSASTAGVMS
ncbi:TPA: hypothetical protein N0F65_011671 [Lagenidium giganteum]|uniref:Exportin-1/Importin-beta-like domain-containing protein n=1 Tax=Lagenidium giganteum TaxID=4803 RepID=A0AAV2ZD83_9STRA|nr:TPA: hypothetical protein N0F65_011671 [Lagenidium giganteum]